MAGLTKEQLKKIGEEIEKHPLIGKRTIEKLQKQKQQDDFEAQIKQAFENARRRVYYRREHKNLEKLESDVLAVYAETQRHSAECLRQHKQQLQDLKKEVLECLRCVDEGVPLTSEGVDFIKKKFDSIEVITCSQK